MSERGTIALAGGAEFGGAMAELDRAALTQAGGLDAPVRIIPAAAAPDNNHRRAGQNGVRWFEHLGARDVAAVPLIDRQSAGDAAVAETLRAARLIYLLGGFTHYLGQTLANSRSWEAVVEAYNNGAVIAGSSAGAMVLCEWYFNPEAARIEPGLGLVPNACVIPHHNTFGRGWAARLTTLLPQATLLGIDERTGMLNTADGGWHVYGQGSVTCYRDGVAAVHGAGAEFRV